MFGQQRKPEQEEERRPAPAQEQQVNPGPPQREGFFSFATKMINPKDTDFGELIAERRAALADASATNSYFWYSAGSTATVLFLLFALWVQILGHKSYEWRAAEAITDLRNAEKLATAKARQAIATYKRHMIQCNRVVEAEIAGRVLPGVAVDQDLQRTAEGLRQKLEATETDNRQLAQRLRDKEELIADLNKRMDRLEQVEPAESQSQTNQQAHPELLALVDRLTRQLDAEQRRNGSLKGA
jgi:hypothetical protein